MSTSAIRRAAITSNRRLHFASTRSALPSPPIPLIDETAYRQRAGGGPSHGHRQHDAQKELVKIARVVPKISLRTDRQTNAQTDTQTGILITILRKKRSYVGIAYSCNELHCCAFTTTH